MNGKPVLGAPRPLYAGPREYRAAEPADTEPLNIAQARQLVEQAIKRGLIKPAEVQIQIVKRAYKSPIIRRTDYGRIPCGICGTEFTKRSVASKFCEPCKWDPRPCISCGIKFTPRSGPKHGSIMRTCSKTCQSALQSVRRKGKAPANKGIKQTTK